jgi:hypothetical protein
MRTEAKTALIFPACHAWPERRRTGLFRFLDQVRSFGQKMKKGEHALYVGGSLVYTQNPKNSRLEIPLVEHLAVVLSYTGGFASSAEWIDRAFVCAHVGGMFILMACGPTILEHGFV